MFRVGFLSGLLLIGCSFATADQYARQAQQRAVYPSKITIELPKISPIAGGFVELVLHLLNDRGDQIPASADTSVQVQMLTLDGKVVQNTNCAIPAKSSVGKCTLGAPSSGVFKVRATPVNRELLGTTENLLVRPAPRSVRKSILTPPVYGAFGVQILRAAYNAPEEELDQPDGQPQPATTGGECEGAPTRGNGQVMVEISDGGESEGAFRAGKDSATISAFFLADDSGTAPAPITVWLSQDHGEIEEKPLVIKPCHAKAVAHLKSAAAAQATVKYHIYPEKYNSQDSTPLRATFITPIAGIGIVPSAKQILSLIDRAPVVAQFYDYDGKAVPTDIPRTVTFVSDNAVIGPKEQSVTVQVGKDCAENILLPYWVGAGSIYVTSEHLRNADPHLVQVTFLAVLMVCLIGSLVGGLVSYRLNGGSMLSRLLFGVAGGIVFAWLHIFWISRKLDWEIVHNAATVFVLALLGGYVGVKVLDTALDKLGWGKA